MPFGVIVNLASFSGSAVRVSIFLLLVMFLAGGAVDLACLLTAHGSGRREVQLPRDVNAALRDGSPGDPMALGDAGHALAVVGAEPESDG